MAKKLKYNDGVKLGILGLALAFGLAMFASGCSSSSKSTAPNSDKNAAADAAKANPYADYITELNNRVDPFWKQQLKLSLDNPDNAKTLIKGQNQVSVALEIQVDKAGKVKKTKVIKSSGYKIIDNAAMKAIKKSSPIPAPPKEWVKGKLATIHWEFVLKDQ